MQLINGRATPVNAGDFVFKVSMTSGTATLAMQLSANGQDSGFSQLTDFSYTSDADGVVTLPTGEIQATLGGDATLFISPLKK